ncbi:uncharacterized protein ARB_00032 [Trichophyton benhamiae CBS 112371]|uniref:COX assembly mitochondrial protein n=1 Tax=Arthroderma benhamiae (strain ATCC MYA-4681 / CBS 112371) TaxID=663331 RepID=D4AV23_ARTBC|nr:uncharacterized protein ARB_00032 [Trichophyton benhamiae CBS 112371]EFE32945.1 hypothetical protein ARB_00032 [Trichophyton benhamiae CBS 112371]
MATTSAPSATETPPTPARRKVDLRNPTPLSATQEAEVKQAYYKKVRGLCDPVIKVTATWVCRKQRLAMNACMVLHARPEIEDLAREEWFAGREERIRAREREAQETEKRRQEVIAMMKKDDEKRAAAKATKSS